MKTGIKKYIDYELAPLTREERLSLIEILIDEILLENWDFNDVVILIKKIEEKDLYIRQPLFEKIIYPILINEIEEENVEAIKCLIKLEPNLFAYQRKHQINEYTTWNLIEKGLEFDKSDKELLVKYEQLLRFWLDYTIHHIPDFLIFNDFEEINPERCDELLNLLETYKNTCQKLDLEKDEYRINLIEECNFHYRNYKVYLEKADKYKNYRDFLNKKTF